MSIDFSKISARLSENTGIKLPSCESVRAIIRDVRHIMFPDYYPSSCDLDGEALLRDIYKRILECAELCIPYLDGNKLSAADMAAEVIEKLPDIRDMLQLDVEALYEGDPAAMCREEIILSYPGFFAVTVYRIAHEFYLLGLKLIARMMTEYAHEKTGIDIHAGATIGSYFFIDHGTGIVIGETTTIGDRVKIYQGVTLGARSFDLDENGNPVKGVKRHPDIGNNVIIYANATILGGNTKVGDGAVIGGNVWLTSSVEPGKTVYYKG